MARAGAPTPQGASVPLENYKKIYIYMYVFTLRPLTTSASSSFFLFVYLFIVLFLTPTKINLGPIVQWFLHLYFPFFFFFFFSRFKIFFYSQWIWIILQLRHPDVKGDTSQPDPHSMSMVGWGHFTKVLLFLFLFSFFNCGMVIDDDGVIRINSVHEFGTWISF